MEKVHIQYKDTHTEWKILSFKITLCTSQFQNCPSPPPRQSPGIWLTLNSIQWGIWPKMRPAQWGIWLSCQNVCQRSETKAFAILCFSTWAVFMGHCSCRFQMGFFLLLSFYIVILWYMSWSEDKLNKKFVVAENFAELVSKAKRFCLFPKVRDSVFPGGWGIWPSLKL